MQGLDLDIYRGGVLGFVGGSGTGKIGSHPDDLGAYPKTQRAYRIFGADRDTSPRICRDRGRIGVMFQQGAVFGSHRQAERRDADARAFAIIAAPRKARDAQDRVDWPRSRCRQQIPSELSGGMTKRAALARAGARPRTCLSRRADVRSRSDRRGGVRRIDRHFAAHARAYRVHGDP